MILLFLSRFCSFRIYKFFDYKINIDNYVDIFVLGIFLQPCGTWPTKNRELDALDYWRFDCYSIVRLSRIGMLSLHLIFTILAIYAYLEWRKILRKEQSAIIKIAMFGPESTGKNNDSISRVL
jgi:nicotinamide mononucleotide transporter